MNQIILQNCSYKDLPKVMPILEAYSDIFDFQDKRYIMQSANKALEEDLQSSALFMAIHDGSIIGFIGGRRNNNNPLQLDVFCLVVKRGFHGQGVGTRMFQHICQFVKQQGYQQIFVKIKGTYPPHTKKFYQRFGFKQYFDEDYTGSSDEDTAMILYL